MELWNRYEKKFGSLAQTVAVFREDIEMEFWVVKCVKSLIRNCKILKTISIELPNGKVMNSFQECENCNYSGILQVDKFLTEEMKRKVSKEYFKQQRIFFKLKSNSGNLIQGINTLVVSLLTLLSLGGRWDGGGGHFCLRQN